MIRILELNEGHKILSYRSESGFGYEGINSTHNSKYLFSYIKI